MRLNIDINTLRQYLDNDPDSEQIARDEYVADIYSSEKPITLNIKLSETQGEVIAAAYLLYDAELDGWYMGERVADEREITGTLKAAIEHVGY